MKNKFKDIQILDNGIVYYDSGLAKYSPEEVEKINKAYYEKQETFIQEILNDGYIEFPILWDNGPVPIWSKCYLPPEYIPSCSEGFEERFGLKYNIYIPSYKRAGITKTDKMLDKFNIENYYLCIDPDQYPEYKKHYHRKHIIIRDPAFKSPQKVDLVSSVCAPDYLSGAAGAAFNPLLYISKSLGEKKYTTMDDDIINVAIKAPRPGVDISAKYDKNNYFRCSLLSLEVGFDFKKYWRDVERIIDSARNLSMLALEKYGLVYTKQIDYLLVGSRAYSFYITNNEIMEDHRGVQNNDSIVSQDCSKHGIPCAILEGYQYASMDTQFDAKKDKNGNITGGGATATYGAFGTLDKSKVLVQAHPLTSKISHIYSRIHHSVDYSPYNKMRIVGSVKNDTK